MGSFTHCHGLYLWPVGSILLLIYFNGLVPGISCTTLLEKSISFLIVIPYAIDVLAIPSFIVIGRVYVKPNLEV